MRSLELDGVSLASVARTHSMAPPMRAIQFWSSSAEIEMWDGAEGTFVDSNSDIIYAAMVTELWSWLLQRTWTRGWP